MNSGLNNSRTLRLDPGQPNPAFPECGNTAYPKMQRAPAPFSGNRGWSLEVETTRLGQLQRGVNVLLKVLIKPSKTLVPLLRLKSTTFAPELLTTFTFQSPLRARSAVVI